MLGISVSFFIIIEMVKNVFIIEYLYLLIIVVIRKDRVTMRRQRDKESIGMASSQSSEFTCPGALCPECVFTPQ